MFPTDEGPICYRHNRMALRFHCPCAHTVASAKTKLELAEHEKAHVCDELYLSSCGA